MLGQGKLPWRVLPLSLACGMSVGVLPKLCTTPCGGDEPYLRSSLTSVACAVTVLFLPCSCLCFSHFKSLKATVKKTMYFKVGKAVVVPSL